MACSGWRRTHGASDVGFTCTVSTRLLPRSGGPDGRAFDAMVHVRHQIAASLRQHPSRSAACLTTLHGPWLPSLEGPAMLNHAYIYAIIADGNVHLAPHLADAVAFAWETPA